MSTFTKLVGSEVLDDSLNLEIYRGEVGENMCELVVTIFLDDKLELTIPEPNLTFSSSELAEILEMVIPFAIYAAGVNDMVRKMDEERRQNPRAFD